MTKEEETRDVQESMLRLDEEMTEIRTQLDHAKARRIKDGEYADSDWWARFQVTTGHNASGRVRWVVRFRSPTHDHQH